MRTISVGRSLAAPRSAVWNVLADFPGISKWNSGITDSYSTSEATEGVGAQRHCDVAPMGALEETVVEWSPEDKMVVSIDEAQKLPIRRGEMTFLLGEDGERTTYSMTYRYVPKGGPLSFVFGPFLDRMLTKGFNGFVDDLETEASRQAA